MRAEYRGIALGGLSRDGGGEGCVLGAGVQLYRAGGAHAHLRVRVLCGGQAEVAHQLVVDVAAARAAAAAHRGDGGDVASLTELRLAAEDVLKVGGGRPDVQGRTAAAVSSAATRGDAGQAEPILLVGDEGTRAASTLVPGGSLGASGALDAGDHGVAVVAVVGREIDVLKPGGLHVLERQLTIGAEYADEGLSGRAGYARVARGASGNADAQVHVFVPGGDGVENLVGARHEHAALAVVILARVGPGVTAADSGAGTIRGNAHGRVELVVGGFRKDREVACEGRELRAASASAGHGYHGDGAVADQLDS